MVNNLSSTKEIRVGSLGQEDPLEEGTATHSNILAWRIPWTEESGSHRVSKQSDMTERLNNYNKRGNPGKQKESQPKQRKQTPWCMGCQSRNRAKLGDQSSGIRPRDPGHLEWILLHEAWILKNCPAGQELLHPLQHEDEVCDLSGPWVEEVTGAKCMWDPALHSLSRPIEDAGAPENSHECVLKQVFIAEVIRFTQRGTHKDELTIRNHNHRGVRSTPALS